MKVAENELYASALKAGRGVHLEEGLCEDFAHAVCWLCAHGLDGAGAGLSVLECESKRGTGVAIARYERREVTHHFFDAPVHVVTPSALDLMVSQASTRAVVHDIDEPLLVVGYAGVAATNVGRAIGLESVHVPTASENGSAVRIDTQGVHGQLWPMVSPQSLRLFFDDASPARAKEALSSRPVLEVTQMCWERLQRFAAVTYVAQSAASRVHGAGGARVDDD
ncbi:MAG: hypothetical protein ACI8PT_001063 [Gammaproteobacteria bacterium]|jgi:hypothetical protein